MDSSTTRRRRLGRPIAAVVTATTLALGGALVAVPAHAAQEGVEDASFTWGLNGYAQRGIFGPWTFKDLSGNAQYLSGATQTEYVTAPFPATSFPANATSGPNPNAVKFTGGAGTIDPATGAAELAWSGSYTINAYPAIYNAPNEIYSDPELSVAADGSGTLSFEFSIGAGVSMDGVPFDAVDFGRLPLATFSAGSISGLDSDGLRLTPDFEGVTLDPAVISGQATACTAPSKAGSWPTDFVETLQSHPAGQSVTAHFYSTGCGGMQDAKPALPIDVSYVLSDPPAAAPSVTVSKTSGLAKGETVTVTGSGFLPAGTATNGTRPPLAGQFSGAYVTFGKYASNWKPSAGVASSARTNLVTKWALPTESHGAVGGANAGAIELKADGTFSVELTLSPTEAQDLAAGNYGIYTYPGGGATYAPFETYTPLTFAHQSDVIVEVPEWVDNPTGSFGWAFAGTSPADLGTATREGANFVATGSLTNIIVTDTRAGSSSPYTWSISGQAGAFTSSGGSFSGGLLGWTPKVVQGGSAVTKGADVTSTQLGGTGLGTSRVLASSTAAATATVGADLALVIPGTTPAGDYTSKLTITALQ